MSNNLLAFDNTPSKLIPYFFNNWAGVPLSPKVSFTATISIFVGWQSIVHLNGNVRQWLLGHIIGISYNRERSQEFKTKNASKEDLLKLINDLKLDLELHLDQLKKLNLDTCITIQSIESTVFSACIHVIEHFSYHTGQIAFITKLLTKKDLGFYNNLPGLND